MDIAIRIPIPRHKRKRYSIYLWFLSAISFYLFVGCMDISAFDVKAIGYGTTCACNGSTLECTDSEGTLHTEPNSDVCDEALLNSQEGICSCDGTTLVCNYHMCKLQVEQNLSCMGMLADSFVVTACDDSMVPVSAAVINGHAFGANVAEMESLFPNSAQCSGNTPNIPITVTPLSPNSGTLPTATVPPQQGGGGGVSATAVPDICANNGGVANVSDVCTCQGVIDRVTFCGDGTKFDTITTTGCSPDPSQCQAGGDTGGQTCQLTVEQCNAQGFGQVDLATCTCYGNYKP